MSSSSLIVPVTDMRASDWYSRTAAMVSVLAVPVIALI